tara:strand:- start:4623 stop:6047 length:1425 start_codon:yes stop_codon:yes gene_type:complete
MLDLIPAIAEIFLLTAICVILLADAFLKQEQRIITFWLSIAALVGATVCTIFMGVQEPVTAINDAYMADPAGNVLKVFGYLVLGIVFFYSRDYLIREGLFKGEFFVLSLFGFLGVMVLISANNLLIIYLGLELLSLSLYALVAFDRNSGLAAESAMKYFVLGAIASGTLLYGISMIYGLTGTISLNELSQYFSELDQPNLLGLLGLAFIIVGIAFKFGAVPFHMWLPDVYQGARTPVTLYIGTAPKLAAFALAWRFFIDGLGGLHGSWGDMLAVLAVASLVLGNLAAIAQTNLKRMLAYSTISHVGFILMGFIAGTVDGLRASMFYTLTYVLMAAAAFGLIIALSRKGFESDNLEDFKGLNGRSPWLALMMLIVMFSMAGVPPFVGFYAKLAVLGSVLDAGLFWLAIIGIVFAVIGAFYYIRVVWYMYFTESSDSSTIKLSPDLRFLLSANVLALLVFGLFPGFLLDICSRVLL